MFKFVIAAALIAVSAPALAQQYPTIVGEWYAEEIGPQDCGTHHAFLIEPMGFREETFVCTFDDVRRDGWQVTWNGSCNDGTNRTQTQVVALETDGRLEMWFNGNPGWSALRRCAGGKVGSLIETPVERIPLHFVEVPLEQAQQYWTDTLADIEAYYDDPWIYTYVAEHGDYLFTSLASNWTCGVGYECPIRIVQNSKIIGEFNTCAEYQLHAVDADFTRYFACENSGQGRLIADLVF